jgi:hypothetical protein
MHEMKINFKIKPATKDWMRSNSRSEMMNKYISMGNVQHNKDAM